MATHTLFIDDSGTKEYANDPSEYEKRRGKSRFFLLCGVLSSLGSAGVLTSKIIEAKLRHFGDDTVEVKSNWLRMPKERQRYYLEPYGINETALTAFVDEYYELICAADIKLVAAVIDKLQMQEDYENPFYPPGLSYEMMLCRVQGDLTIKDNVAVIIDDTSGNTPKGNDYKDLLIRQHANLKKNGSRLWKGFALPSLGSQKFVSSQISHLVQVADVCAYNVYRQFIEHGDDWEQAAAGTTLPMYEHFRKINGMFRCGPGGRVQGYGIVKMPQRKKILWTKT